MDRIVFLGTAGARIAVFKQIRASGGIWITLDDTNILVDPGPGSLIRCLKSKAKLDPLTLDGILISHRHLDHSGDINIMIEAMTQGGFKPKGTIFAPKDALEQDPIILRYIRTYVSEIKVLEEGNEFSIGNIKISTPLKHIHGRVETYGVNFLGKNNTISYIADTKFFDKILEVYRGNVLIINVVFLEPRNIDHLSFEDAKVIIKEIRPKLAILTHFGMTMIKAKPWELSKKLSDELNIDVRAASDGMNIELP